MLLQLFLKWSFAMFLLIIHFSSSWDVSKPPHVINSSSWILQISNILFTHFFFVLEEILILEVTIVVFSIFMKSMIFFLIQAIFIYWKKNQMKKQKNAKKWIREPKRGFIYHWIGSQPQLYLGRWRKQGLVVPVNAAFQVFPFQLFWMLQRPFSH